MFAAAQESGPELTQKDSTPTFQSRVDLVLVPVIVRDAQGKTVAGLTKQDFQLFDKGKLQTIATFSVVKQGAPQSSAPSVTITSPAAPNEAAPAEPVVADRFVAYLFDDLNSEPGDLIRLKKAAAKHITDGLQPNERAAIYTTSGQTMLDFTSDKARLQETLTKVQPRPMFQHTPNQCPDLTYYWADLIINKNDSIALQAATTDTLACMQLDPTQSQTAQSVAQSTAQHEVSVGEQGTRITLGVIKNLIRRLSAMPGRRLLVLASPGFLASTPEAINDKSDILDLAARMNVMISTLNSRGLFTTNLDASQQGAYSIQNQRIVEQYFAASALAAEDVLEELADGTGGIFFHNSNDLDAGFVRVAAAPEVSYILGFSPQSLKPDGSFHRLKITVARKDINLQARRGYYALKHTRNPEEDAKSDIQDAVFSRDEMHDIPVDLKTQFFKPDPLSAKLTILAKMDLRGLQFKKTDGRNCDQLMVASVLFDTNGNYVSGMIKTLDMKLRDTTLAGLSSGITVKTSFDVKPGTYIVRLVVRDSEGHSMAAQNGAVEIP